MSQFYRRKRLAALIGALVLAAVIGCTTATSETEKAPAAIESAAKAEPKAPATKEPPAKTAPKAAPTAPAAKAAPKAPAGPTGKAVIGVAGLHHNMAPLVLGSPTRQHINGIFDNLVRVEPNREIVGDLAKSWKLLDDGLTWEFELYPGVKFHDGTPANAEAIKWSFDWVMDPKNSSSLITRSGSFDKVVAKDETTLQIVTKAPDPIVHLRVESFPLSSPKLYEDTNGDGWDDQAAGSGAFKLKEYVSGGKVVLEAILDPMPHHDTAKIAEVEYRAIPEASARMAALRNGEIDLADGLDVGQGETLKSEGFNLQSIAVPQTLALTMNIMDPSSENTPVKDPVVRNAVIRSINNVEIAEVVFNGLVAPANQIITPGSTGHDPDLKQPDYDPAAAKRMLADAGYPDGFSSKMHVLAASQPTITLGTEVAGYLDEIGIKVEIEQMVGPSFAELFIQGGMHPFYVSRWTHSNLDGAEALRWLRTGGGPGAPRFANPKYDELWDQQAVEMDLEKRNTILQQMSRILIEEDPIQKYLIPTPRFVVTAPRLRDFFMTPAKSDIASMYIED